MSSVFQSQAIDELCAALDFHDRVLASSSDDQIAVGRDHFERLEKAVRAVVSKARETTRTAVSEVCTPVYQDMCASGQYDDVSKETYDIITECSRRILYSCPVDVAALEAKITLLKAQVGALQGGSVRQVIHSPLRFFNNDE